MELPRVIYCGGRSFSEIPVAAKALIRAHAEVGDHIVVHGACRGADLLVAGLAEDVGWETEAHPANWEKHGKSAGFIRNQEMADLENVVLVVALPGGNGTASMKKIAETKGIKVICLQMEADSV